MCVATTILVCGDVVAKKNGKKGSVMNERIATEEVRARETTAAADGRRVRVIAPDRRK